MESAKVESPLTNDHFSYSHQPTSPTVSGRYSYESNHNSNNDQLHLSDNDSLIDQHIYQHIATKKNTNGFYNDLLQDDNQELKQQQYIQRISEGTQTTPSLESPPSPSPVQLTYKQQTPSLPFSQKPLPTWPSGNTARFQTPADPTQEQSVRKTRIHYNPYSSSNNHTEQQQQQHPYNQQQNHKMLLLDPHSNSPASTPPPAAAAAVASMTLKTPMTPPRISSLSPPKALQSSQFLSTHQQQQKPHSPPPSPPQPASLDHLEQQHYRQQQHQHQGRYDNNIYSNGYTASSSASSHSNRSNNAFNLEPSPTLSNTETFPSHTTKSTNVSSPASSISIPIGNSSPQPTPVDYALAALSANPPRPSTSTTSSVSSGPAAGRPRPSSYAPIKISDVSSTLANMSTLATLPIPSASAASSVPSSSPSSPLTKFNPAGAFPPPLVTSQRQQHQQEQQQQQQQQQQYQKQQIQEQQDQSPQPELPQQPEATASMSTVDSWPEPSARPSMTLVPTGGASGAGGGYKAGPSPYGPPTRASTMDYRKLPHGSITIGPDSPNSSASRQNNSQQQLDPQAESSSRARRKQLYRRNTYSVELATSSFPRSDDEMEMDEVEDARRSRMDALKKSSSRRMSKRKKDDNDDRVMIGTPIGEDHVNYVLMYNMLTGIRVSVSRCQAKLQRPLVDEDFTSAHKLAFDITGNELTPSSKYDFKFKDYAPWVFRNLREDFHIDASDYLMSLTSKYILSELGSPGKSGSFFYFSQDYRFIIKTIHHAEHKFMRKILKDYFNHVKQNPHTLLCRFFGLHRVKLPHGRKIHFVVMGNVFPPNRDIHETYDLKGSTLGRAISDEELNNNPRATQKDLNWVNRNRKLELGPEKRHLFVEQTKRDVELLARLNIMDYSLLIGIHDLERGNKDNIRDNTLKVFHPDTTKQLVREPSRRDKRESKVNALRMAVKVSDPQALGPSTLPSDSFSERRHCIFYADDGGLLSTNEQNVRGEDLYYLGIIDILTPYNYVKKIEHYWKAMSQDRHAISSVNPREYASRFLSFMIHAIKMNHDVLPVLEAKSHPHSE
ncbi:Phosphatidylinositol-4-phosphate 5-kinase [Linnemannia exigua]|uniref:1-phosphatidylinositol-4-phosphate 5-kinase n=1 Tax=Linnemannia exigua TaxID=604196 RepID=A0AAD4D8T4_9FUNG|nr:Phosphatidylinositol-4-phosphate 5-kinase [Linnemannia exigua]